MVRLTFLKISLKEKRIKLNKGHSGCSVEGGIKGSRLWLRGQSGCWSHLEATCPKARSVVMGMEFKSGSRAIKEIGTYTNSTWACNPLLLMSC